MNKEKEKTNKKPRLLNIRTPEGTGGCQRGGGGGLG